MKSSKRPLNPIEPRVVEVLMKNGASNNEIAKACRVARVRVEKWIKENKELVEQWKKKKKKAEGKPPIIASPEEMEKLAEDYFNNCPDKITVYNGKNSKPLEVDAPTIMGLTLHLGFVSRASLLDYEAKPEYSAIIKKARSRVEKGYEKDLRGRHAYGCKFALAAGFGWAEKKEIEAGENLRDVIKGLLSG